MIGFNLLESIQILERTPETLKHLLQGLPETWLRTNEGRETWSPYDVLGHLIVGEKTDWMVRTKIIMSAAKDKSFVPFDRFTQMREDQTRSIEDLLSEFAALRASNLSELKRLQLTKEDLKKTGLHPEFGSITLAELLATWTAHDLGHIAQICRVMAKQYRDAVGPWTAYLGILK